MSKSSVRFASQCQYSAYRKLAVSQRGDYTRTDTRHVSRMHSPSVEIEGMAHAIFAALAFGCMILAACYGMFALHVDAWRDAGAAFVCFLAAGMLTKDQLSRAAQTW